MKFGIVAVVASSLVAGVQPQEGYCTWAPNRLCWQSGYPECCATDNGADCPLQQPDCDIVGSSYCTWSPNYGCYQSGWPACCDDASTCTQQRAGCDVNNTQPLDGASYCTFAPDYSCYTGGWPACCVDNDVPDVLCGTDTEPPCDLTPTPGASYCTYAPNFGCWTSGFPECCQDDASTCPETEVDCDVVGNRWCAADPDFNCYVNGVPICCITAGAICPEAKPTCEISDEHVDVDLGFGGDAPTIDTTPELPVSPGATPADGESTATTTAPEFATTSSNGSGASQPAPSSAPTFSGAAAIYTGSKALLSIASMMMMAWIMV